VPDLAIDVDCRGIALLSDAEAHPFAFDRFVVCSGECH